MDIDEVDAYTFHLYSGMSVVNHLPCERDKSRNVYKNALSERFLLVDLVYILKAFIAYALKFFTATNKKIQCILYHIFGPTLLSG